MYKSKREELDILAAELQEARSSFEPHWKECAKFTAPHRPRFVLDDENRGQRMNQEIMDSTPGMALRTLSSGMMSGVTSPARPWKRLSTQDPELAEYGRNKTWLGIVDRQMTNIFTRSNLYQVLPSLYKDLGNIGTAPILMDEDNETVVNFTGLPTGSYWLSKDHRGRVNLMRRELRMTVRQLIAKFGRFNPKTGSPDWSNFSDRVKRLWDESRKEAWVDVIHVIRPNPNFNPRSPFAKEKRFESVYYEKGVSYKATGGYDAGTQFLRESGYSYFPVLAPRWEVSGSDVYGTDCPTMTVLGDIKGLMFKATRKGEALDKMVRPPMVAHPDLKQTRTSILPSDITFIEEPDGRPRFRPALELNTPYQAILEDIQDARTMISRGYYEDLFLMLSRSDRRQITAREIEERYEEKLLALGPVLQQIDQDLLSPLIDNTFDIMLERQMIPEPPEELTGQDLKVEYISVMAQAQKSIALRGIDQIIGYVGQTAQINPDVVHKVDFEQIIDEAGDALGVSPRIIRSDEQVAEIKKGIAEASAQAAQQAQAMQQSQIAKNMSQTNLEGDNALSRMVQQAEAGQIVEAV